MDREISDSPKPHTSSELNPLPPKTNEALRTSFLKGVINRFKKQEDEKPTDAKPPVLLQFRSAHDKFQKRSPELTPTFDALFKAFNSELLINSAMFTTADGQATLPYSTINVTEFARKIFKGNPYPLVSEAAGLPSSQKLEIEHGQGDQKKERYYIIGSHLILKDGQLSYVEIAFHEFMKKLSAILEDLKTGKEPVDREIVMPGAPSSMFGHVTEDFANRVHRAPTVTYGSMFKEFIDNHLAKDKIDPKEANIVLHGFSMGSSWSAETAKQMEENGVSVRVLMDSPTGLHDKRKRITNRRMDIGFGADAAIGLATNPDVSYFSVNERLFWDKITPYLEQENDYEVYLDQEQIKLKKGMIADTVSDLREGIPVDESVHAFVRQGKKDLSMTTVPFLFDVAKKQASVKISKAKTFTKTVLGKAFGAGGESSASEDLANSLGKDQLPGYTPRTFAINSQHLYPFFRENELRRWEYTTKILDDMVKRGQVELPSSIVSDKPLSYHAGITDRFGKTA